MKNEGQKNYESDIKQRPWNTDGSLRPLWDELMPSEQETWNHASDTYD